MTKTPNFKLQIDQNKKIISAMMSGSGTHKRLNNMNWLRHEISYTEPRTLFYVPNRQQMPYLDYNCMKNLGEAYDYVIDNSQQLIDATEICKLHSMLCTDTHIQGAIYRHTSKVLEIKLNGNRIHAPDASEIPSRINQIIYKLHNSHESTLNKAFNIHYDLIMLQPFDDFNKRTARLIMNWVLVQGGYRPIVFNHPSDKQNYISAIAQRANGNTKEYTAYMMSCMIRTQKQIISLLKKSKVL